MEKPSGRHRKPVRGWAQQVQWLFGAVLAAVLCSSVDARRQERRPLPASRSGVREHPRSLPGTGTAVPGVQRLRSGSALAAARHPRPVPRPVRVPRPREPHPSEQGWCVDDDGVRGVRPYLFHRPGQAPHSGEQVPAGPGEFDELAGLVRTWLATHR
ncbi:hypothetical protein [Nocardiopsis sp. ATB16-24]|uniref:hypothetical protein n=1 Tax=Nocardiopsis sp. ATB16-24 TaxID=3019555 RepID=UPI002552100C|nr:hypothetical protein [Nocardiopsis sp. ATB16-24]